MTGIVLDAFALLAWLSGETGAPVVRHWLEEAEVGRARVVMSVINAGEVYYRLLRLGRTAEAASLWRDLRRGLLPVRLMPVPPRRVLAAAALKAQYPIAYADAFAAQLARELSLPLLTGDPEFGPLVAAGLLTVVWLA